MIFGIQPIRDQTTNPTTVHKGFFMKIAILGAGNMGKAIISGLLRTSGETIAIIAFDKRPSSLTGLDSRVTIAEPASWFSGETSPDAIIIAVKPFDIASALQQFQTGRPEVLVKPLWISIAAGKNIAALRPILPEGARICRVMPNTPALIGEGMSAFSLSENALDADAALVEKIFSACGKTSAVPEKLMNAVTGLSGSGPAYVFHFIESLIEAGVVAGLPYQVARECALQTVAGAAKMAASSSESPGELTMKVMTPAGTTASAITVLEQHAFKHILIKAVGAATKRSEDMEKGVK
jgi:pyrroline-5-carboxylate reductase